MTTARWMITSLFALAAPLGLLACDGDDDAGDEAAEAGDESTGGESEGDETLGRTDADVGVDVDEGSLDFGEAGDDRDDADTDEPTGCAANLDKAECDAAAGCASVLGNAILPEGDGWCSAAQAEYIGCVNSGNLCPSVTEIVCGGDQMWMTTDCVPDTLTVCEGPGDISGVCDDALVRI